MGNKHIKQCRVLNKYISNTIFFFFYVVETFIGTPRPLPRGRRVVPDSTGYNLHGGCPYRLKGVPGTVKACILGPLALSPSISRGGWIWRGMRP